MLSLRFVIKGAVRTEKPEDDRKVIESLFVQQILGLQAERMLDVRGRQLDIERVTVSSSEIGLSAFCHGARAKLFYFRQKCFF